MKSTLLKYAAVAGASALALPAVAQQTFTTDVIVQGSLCVGIDCTTSESFGFDTIRLKENNLRIRAQDTSASASFPSVDWQITFNDSSNGGANKFSIDDIDNGRTPFTIEASAPTNSLYVDDGGRIGAGTATPVVNVHVVEGNTPTLRLEQDGSSGFTPQTFDLASNEANFFVRDVTNGSALPFRIFPDSPQNALVIEGTTGHIGIGVQSPTAMLHLSNAGSGADGLPRIRLDNRDGSEDFWDIDVSDNDTLRISLNGSGRQEFQIDSNGNVTFAALANCTNGIVTDANGTLACAP